MKLEWKIDSIEVNAVGMETLYTRIVAYVAIVW